jgi:tetratricopeptide (TPR) repeat protein
MKRQICIRKAMGDVPLTIKLLNDYLKLFMGDTDAWQELAELYLDQQMYQRAAFCYEELMLAFPQNYHFCTKYAEVSFPTINFMSFYIQNLP